MNVATQLAEVMQRGARLVFQPAPERPIIRCLSSQARRALQPLLAPDVRPRAQALLVYVVDYRSTLLELFRLNAEGADIDQAHSVVAEEIRLVDELGPLLADAVRAQVSAEYLESTGRCPACGGAPHVE
jgi:hypothetical protein